VVVTHDMSELCLRAQGPPHDRNRHPPGNTLVGDVDKKHIVANCPVPLFINQVSEFPFRVDQFLEWAGTAHSYHVGLAGHEKYLDRLGLIWGGLSRFRQVLGNLPGKPIEDQASKQE